MELAKTQVNYEPYSCLAQVLLAANLYINHVTTIEKPAWNLNPYESTVGPWILCRSLRVVTCFANPCFAPINFVDDAKEELRAISLFKSRRSLLNGNGKTQGRRQVLGTAIVRREKISFHYLHQKHP